MLALSKDQILAPTWKLGASQLPVILLAVVVVFQIYCYSSVRVF